MSLQGLMNGTNPLLIMAAALLYFLFLYIRRGSGSDRSESDAASNHPRSNEIDDRSADGAATSTVTINRHNDVLADAQTATSTAARAAAGYEFSEDTLRRHNTVWRYDRDGAGVTGAAAAGYAASGHVASGHSSSSAGELHTPHVPAEFTHNEGSTGGSWRFPLIAALCASLVSCQIASNDGIAGIPGNIASLLGGRLPAATPVAKVEPKVETKVATKVEPKIEAKVEAKSEPVNKSEPVKVVAAETPAPAPAPAPASAPAPVAGLTSYFGFATKSDAAQLWAAPATVYGVAAAPAPVAVAPVPAPAPVPAAPELPPVSLGGVGQTSFYGIADKPDATFPWAAAATVYKVAAPEPAPAPAPVAAAPEATPVSLGGVGQTSFYGIADKPDATFPWAAAATVFEIAAPAPAPAAPEAAPVSLGGVGQTSYYGIAEKPDATFPWAAAATVYKAAAPAPSPAPVAPATPAAVNTCRDLLNAEAKAGKINFATSRFEILPDSFPTLDKLAKLAKGCGGVVIDVGGHTDSTGKAASNKSLSELRAKAVVRYLTGAGVDAGKLKATGYGQDRPVADNATDAGRRQNRRIEFTVSAP